MNTCDLVGTIFIFFIFIVLNLFNVLGASLAHIKKNWPKYRCVPAVIPFAGFFGHDVLQNFNYCIQNMQVSRMSDLLAPAHFQLSNLSDQTTSSNTNSNNSRGFLSNLRGDITDITGGIMNTFLNMLIQIQKILIRQKDMFAKFAGIQATQLFILSGSVLTLQSTWNGPPGQIVRALCFHPETLVRMQDKSLMKIKDIKSGNKLKNNRIVYGTMQLHNLDENEKIIEPLYEINEGENNQPVLVTGSHLIYDPEKEDFIYVKDSPLSKLSTVEAPKLVCLITSDHLIPLGKHVFHDWEDNH